MNGTDLIKFAVDTLKADSRYADVDMSETSVFYNLVILPFSILSKPVFDLNDSTLNALNINNMTEAQLDDFAIPYATRRTESSLTLQVDIYLTNTASPVEPLIITTGDEFRTGSNQLFNPMKDYIFAFNTLPFDGTSTYRVATIFTTSSQSYNQITENSIATSSISHPQLSFVTNTKASSSPIATETNAEFILDIQKALARKTDPTLDLKLAYPVITDALAIGYGDPEMQRDIAVAGKDWSGHFGGMRDILIRTPLTPTTFTTTATKNDTNDGYTFTLQRYKGYDWEAQDLAEPDPQTLAPWIKLTTTPLPELPVVLFDFESSTITNTAFILNSDGRVKYTVEVMPDPEDLSYGKNYRYSCYENLRITVYTGTLAGDTEDITLHYSTLSSIEEIQTYIGETANRELCCNDLIKSFIPIEIKELNITYDTRYVVNETLWRTNISDIINNWVLVEPIRLTTLVKDFPAPVRIDEIWATETLPYLTDTTGIISGTQSATSYPSYATMLTSNIDGTDQYYLSTRQLYPMVKSGLSTSYRTCRYFIDPTNIIFTKGSW